MNYGEIVLEGLKKNRITITKAAKWLGLTRQSFYIRLNKGTFTVNEINTLAAKGVIGKTKTFTVEQIGDYLLNQKSLDDAIMNLDEEAII